MNERVLLVEDDESLRAAISAVLQSAGMRVTEVGDGRTALEQFDDASIDVVVLDIMLPGLDGFEVCRELRQRSQAPIVVVTAKDAPKDIVHGLELGADDYVVKPFEGEVLLARLRAVLRRSATGDDQALELGSLRVDPDAVRATSHGEILPLSATEFRLLTELLRNAGKAMTREALLESVWGYTYLGDSRLVDMAIKRLRTKLKSGDADVAIAAVHGVGYRLEQQQQP